ncbi:MAG: ABC transporter permease [Lachnospiraceae bacterium]|nr:ABC transporter permease [Lachnospiraceae bacterium]
MGKIYWRLAREGIAKNRQLYIPFIITAVCMVMMTYIMGYLASEECTSLIPVGKRTVTVLMQFGMIVVVVFSLIFMLYTYSFIMRRRQKEFGLYNVLGMDKRNLSKVIFRETVIYGIISLLGGLFAGVLFSKLFELMLIRMTGGEITYTLRVLPDVMLKTAGLFLIIFIVISVTATVRTGASSAVTLLKSENTGEKAPKAGWLPALAGVCILAAAYFLAVTVDITYPRDALRRFFIAVIMVIVATYLIMIAGSVFFCGLLRKNKKYYYKKEHFVSVSSMAYRMKRNGAGLASICIIATVVLVTISTTTCLLFGVRDVMDKRYPADVNVYVWLEPDDMAEFDTAAVRDRIDGIVKEKGGSPEAVTDMKYGSIYGQIEDGCLYFRWLDDVNVPVTNVYILDSKEYERISGRHMYLKSGEAYIVTEGFDYEYDRFCINNEENPYLTNNAVTLSVKAAERGEVAPVPDQGDRGDRRMYLIVDDMSEALQPLYADGYYRYVETMWLYCMDTGLGSMDQTDMPDAVIDLMGDILAENESIRGFGTEGKEIMALDARANYGGLFFTGVILSGVFILAAVLIIYYKQLSEGYEDRARFDIMQKVGMTKKEIKKSINSQLLTVFFLPLIFAGMHLLFAFPMIRKILLLFEISNTWLFAMTTVISYVIFAVFYAVVYKLTSNAYYRIVS